MERHLAAFVRQMDELVAAKDDAQVVADETEGYLAELLRHPEFLEDRHRRPARTRYQQHVVHVHPEGKYSLVSLVWRPGQETPIHDHRCWCVVGVLQGRERETRYQLYDGDDGEVLVVTGDALYDSGQVCALVPPVEDIHKVANGGDEGLSISLHVYGDDIATVGTSINRVFRQPVVANAAAGARAISWRDGT